MNTPVLFDKLTETKFRAHAAIGLIEDMVSQLVIVKSELTDQLSRLSEDIQNCQLNGDKVKEFWQQPYAIIPRREGEYYVIAPTFVDFQIGWLEKTVKGWNYFVVNKFTSWLAQVPKELKDKFHFAETLPLQLDGNTLLTGIEHQEEAWHKYNSHLRQRRGKDQIVVKDGHEFALLAEMIGDGILPFVPHAVAPEDRRTPSKLGFELRPYQLSAWEKFLALGCLGVFWPPSAGKTFISMWALAHLKGPKLVVVPSLTLHEQWTARINKFLPAECRDITVVTYNSYPKVRDNQYSLIVFDECHRLPANSFARLATIRAKYRLGLSATPYREDGRTDFIFALTGFPVGLDWRDMIKTGLINKPSVTLYLVNDANGKMNKLKYLLQDDKNTLVYSYWLELGEQIADKFALPFVHGGTKNRLDILTNNQTVVVSSVGGEGVSLPKLERVIEVGFLFGSRREEAQLLGRLFHSEQAEPEHIILMTEAELDAYEKRLYALQEKGFRINVIR